MSPARQHHCTIIEGEMPRYFTIICQCGWRSKTYWGEEDALYRIDMHRFEKGELTVRQLDKSNPKLR